MSFGGVFQGGRVGENLFQQKKLRVKKKPTIQSKQQVCQVSIIARVVECLHFEGNSQGFQHETHQGQFLKFKCLREGKIDDKSVSKKLKISSPFN